MQNVDLDYAYLTKHLINLLNIPSPSGYTDQIVHYVGDELQKLDIPFHVTRRGAIRATIKGRHHDLDRAIAVHLDTLGAMVKHLKKNGRLKIAPIGTWSSRFAEGARVTIFTGQGPFRGTILPLKASGHAYGDEIDTQKIDWDHIEIRVDEKCRSKQDLVQAGFDIGDFVAVDAAPELTPNCFLNARHIDDKGGVAILMTLAKWIVEKKVVMPVDCHLIFTILEEVGYGATAVIQNDVVEMVIIDNATVAPDQNSSEYGATIAMMDHDGPFDYHLTHKLINLCVENQITYSRDIFNYYKSDAASAIQAGNDTRTALVGFGVDGSHGYERVHTSSLLSVATLMGVYVQSMPTFARDKDNLAPLKGFPHQPVRDLIQINT
ncbi:MAG: osmoprotectant NAGGN system M42 family peptidase [Candidatus Magnetomorum sp.]|nr:osmoprotectant NAGGN system M42 family peptidase [Candidatus Magnetomorum sp.]